MLARISLVVCLCAGMSVTMPLPVQADNLYRDGAWADMTADRRASQVGDILSVLVAETTEARNSARNSRGKSTSLSATATTDASNAFGDLSFGSNQSGTGEIRRSESFVTTVSVTVEDVLPNGDLFISGHQRMFINGEWSMIAVRGRVRDADITGDNQVYSSRIADAEISYNGQGYVTSATDPGIFHWLATFLGII